MPDNGGFRVQTDKEDRKDSQDIMKTAGIIAEYNPFHNGHEYHIAETRRRTGADYIIAVISGDFVQRGAPALLSKYDRARMALQNGADLVFELPVTTALSSAEGFAAGGVSLLSGLGVVDVLSCGCESADGDPALFRDVVAVLADEPDAFRAALSLHLRSGMSFPRARELALTDYMLRNVCRSDPASGIRRLLSGPNNILALEYARAIRRSGSTMDICMIPRMGDSYHCVELPHSALSVSGNGFRSFCPSATAIREYLLTEYRAESGDDPLSALRGNVPASVLRTLCHACQEHQLLREDDFSDLLSYALITNKDRLDTFGSGNPDLAYRTANRLEQYDSWSGFSALLKTKNQTYTAVSRYLAHVLLQLHRDDFSLAEEYARAPYARLLGFCKSAVPLLKSVRAQSEIPVLVQTARDSASLNGDQKHLLDLDIQSSEIYKQILYTKSGRNLKSEYRQSTICMP